MQRGNASYKRVSKKGYILKLALCFTLHGSGFRSYKVIVIDYELDKSGLSVIE